MLLFGAGAVWYLQQPQREPRIMIFMVLGVLTSAFQAWVGEPLSPIARMKERRKERVAEIAREQERLIRASHGAEPGELSVAAPAPDGDVSLADSPGAVSVVAPRKQKTER